MIELKMEYLAEIGTYLEGEQIKDEFEDASESERYEILDFLEKLMELGELADKRATDVIFKGQLEMLAGMKTDK